MIAAKIIGTLVLLGAYFAGVNAGWYAKEDAAYPTNRPITNRLIGGSVAGIVLGLVIIDIWG